VRFGPRLSVTKSVDADTLDVIVPSMLLQPLVENAIKHGVSRKVGAGNIIIRAWRERDTATIEVEDDGLGISEERLPIAMSHGIGLSNVKERLMVLYGDGSHFSLTGAPGQGARARVVIPLTVTGRRMAS